MSDAQELMEQQQGIDWPRVLGELVKQCHPCTKSQWTDRGGVLLDGAQSEYATDDFDHSL